MPSKPIEDSAGTPVALGDKVNVEFAVIGIHSTPDAVTYSLESSVGTPPAGTKVLVVAGPGQVVKPLPPPPLPDAGRIADLEAEVRTLTAKLQAQSPQAPKSPETPATKVS